MEFAQWLSKSFGTGVLSFDAGVLIGTCATLAALILLLSWTSRGSSFSALTGAQADQMSGRLDNLHIELKSLSQAFAFEVITLRKEIQLTCSRARSVRDEIRRAG